MVMVLAVLAEVASSATRLTMASLRSITSNIAWLGIAVVVTVVAVVMVVINKYVDKNPCTLYLHLRAVARVRLRDLRFGIPEDEFKVHGV